MRIAPVPPPAAPAPPPVAALRTAFAVPVVPKVLLVLAAFAVLAAHPVAPAFAQEPEGFPGPSILVSGHGESSAPPDQATVRLGATAQAERADAAQSQVSEIVRRALDAVGRLGIPREDLRTVGINLYPVYANEPPEPRGGEREPRIAGYRASNTVQIRLDDLDRVGAVIDAGVQAGANQIEGVFYDLKDDAAARNEALKAAVRAAQEKAEAMAEALGVRLGDLLEVSESAQGPGYPPYPMMARMDANEASTPVEPGRVVVQAAVTLRYRLAGGD